MAAMRTSNLAPLRRGFFVLGFSTQKPTVRLGVERVGLPPPRQAHNDGSTKLSPAVAVGGAFSVSGRWQPTVSCSVDAAGLSANLLGVAHNLSDGPCWPASPPSPLRRMPRRDLSGARWCDIFCRAVARARPVLAGLAPSANRFTGSVALAVSWVPRACRPVRSR